MQTALQDFMTVKEAATFLSVTDRRIRSLVAEGKLLARRAGERVLLVSRDSVEAEASRRSGPTPQRRRKPPAALAS